MFLFELIRYLCNLAGSRILVGVIYGHKVQIYKVNVEAGLCGMVRLCINCESFAYLNTPDITSM